MDTGKLHLGPCEVVIDPDGTPVTLTTEGGCDITMTAQTSDLMTDETGTTPVNSVITGAAVSLKVNMADYDLEKFASAFPNATLNNAKTKLEIRTAVGTSLLDSAKTVRLKKFVNGVASATKDDWITFPKACPGGGEVSFSFKKDSQTLFPVTFKCFPDTSNNNRIVVFGDITAS